MLKHLDYLMIDNGGCNPFHYMIGNGGLGYKPHEPYIHGIGTGFNSYKNKFNTKYHFPKDQSHTLIELSKLSGYDKDGLQTIYNKGIGAYHTNPQSVRPQVKSPEQWAMARVYAAINPRSKAHRVDKSHLKGLGFEKDFPTITDELQEAEEDEKEEVYKNILLDGFNKLETDEDTYLDKEISDSRTWLEIYNQALNEGFFDLRDPRVQSIHDKAQEVMEYQNHLVTMKVDKSERDLSELEKNKELEKSELETLELEHELENPVDQELDNDIWVNNVPEENIEGLMNGRRGYDFYGEMKRKYNINLPNGEGYEAIQNEPELKELIAKYTGDDSDVVDQKVYFEGKLMPTEEVFDEWIARNLTPLRYLPSDSSNDSTIIEKKNYIATKNDPGRYIDPIAYKEITKLQKEGKSPGEIEQIFKKSGREVPTLPITESKLTGMNSNGKLAKTYHYFKEDPTTGERYLEKIIWGDLIPDAKGKTLVQAPVNYPIWKGKKGFIYDMLINNARVIYNPLKDENLLISGGRFNAQGRYKSEINPIDKKKYFLIPITRMDVHIRK